MLTNQTPGYKGEAWTSFCFDQSMTEYQNMNDVSIMFLLVLDTNFAIHYCSKSSNTATDKSIRYPVG